ncbi:MAG: hypothetical protein HeimC3_00420 [Candidatus Heimdallarchaeota archaeon LC_3]|nr:MAG: hypothetical protein HeimC3_00420 [Candidatus Heimdallarchaeota archaeon LC_3]
MSPDQIFEGIFALAVIWDERAGPTIISLYPEDSLSDPIGVALQIYLSSVAVFGQHQQAQRIDFSLPLLSISPNHLVRVAFDSWPDLEVRGEVRPFYIGFIMDKETDRIVIDDLTKNIWNYIDQFKREKRDYKVKSAWVEINANYMASKQGLNKQSIIDLKSENEDIDYTVLQAIRDIEIASDYWLRDNDRRALPLALKTAYKLDNVENGPAGHAYFLAGTIFTQTGDFENALEHFSKSVDSFKKANDLENAAEAMFNVAVVAFRLEKYDLAKSNILLSSDIQQDNIRKAKLYLQLAKIHIKLKEYDSASNSFEFALENSLKTNDYKLAAEILSYYSFRLAERAQATTDENFQFSLYEHSASQRERAAEYLILAAESLEAASSLLIASKIFLQIKNETKVIELLLKAKTLFLKDSDFISASRILVDLINMQKGDLETKESYAKEALQYSEKIADLDVRSLIKSRVLNEMAKICRLKNSGWEAKEYYNEALSIIQDRSENDFIKISLNYANFLYQIEDYGGSGDIFYQISGKLGLTNSKGQKSLKNAHLSYKKAVGAYLQTANTLLHNKNFKEAISYYEKVIGELDMAYKTTNINDQGQIKEWINQIRKSIRSKSLLFNNDQNKHLEKIDSEFIFEN